MTTRRTTKKTAKAPKAEPEQVPEQEQEQAPEPTQQKWPLGKGDYFSVPVTSRHGHSGTADKDDAAIRTIQQAVGVTVDGQYGNETATAVAQWRAEQGLGRGNFVDKEAWQVLTQGEDA